VKEPTLRDHGSDQSDIRRVPVYISQAQRWGRLGDVPLVFGLCFDSDAAGEASGRNHNVAALQESAMVLHDMERQRLAQMAEWKKRIRPD
jgi:hypothetical protein